MDETHTDDVKPIKICMCQEKSFKILDISSTKDYSS